MSQREAIQKFLNFEPIEIPVAYDVQETMQFDGYSRERIVYIAPDGDEIPAYLLTPEKSEKCPAILIHHQHNGQRHLGKSEVAGIAGDPLQAFAPALAKRGFGVLAADSICFEDRRKQASGIEPYENDDLQHFIEMGNRLTTGDTLMRKVLADASTALSLLKHHPKVDSDKIGILGHSYGGNTVLFQAAVDSGIAFAVSSGALCSYTHKRQHDIALEMALIIPGFAERWDMHDLLDCFAPHHMLIVSAENDIYSQDADDVITRANSDANITHYRDDGNHPLTQARFDFILNFISECVSSH